MPTLPEGGQLPADIWEARRRYRIIRSSEKSEAGPLPGFWRIAVRKEGAEATPQNLVNSDSAVDSSESTDGGVAPVALSPQASGLSRTACSNLKSKGVCNGRISVLVADSYTWLSFSCQ